MKRAADTEDTRLVHARQLSERIVELEAALDALIAAAEDDHECVFCLVKFLSIVTGAIHAKDCPVRTATEARGTLRHV